MRNLILALILGFLASGGAYASLVDNRNGTVTDTSTGLMWQKCTSGQTWSGSNCAGNMTTMTWSQGMEFVEGLTLAGYNDWRMPNIDELETLYYLPTPSLPSPGTIPSIPVGINPLFSVDSREPDYWSSTTFPTVSDAKYVYSYWPPGMALPGGKYVCIFYVRAVRTAQETVLTDLEKANKIFNWLESEFPEILSPTPQPTYESNGIYFRYYPGTNVYIGTIQNHLYFYDHLGVLHNLGSVDIWLPFAQGN